MKTITLGELRHELTELLKRPDDTQVMFGSGDLSYYRFKERGPYGGPDLVQLEFNELYQVTLDPTAP
jgi:hypothetical protein